MESTMDNKRNGARFVRATGCDRLNNGFVIDYKYKDQLGNYFVVN